MDEERRRLIEAGKTKKRRWWQRREPGNTVFDDDRLHMQALAALAHEKELATTSQEELKKLLERRVAQAKQRREIEHTGTCVSCSMHTSDLIQTKTGAVYCQHCYSNLANGPVSQAELDYVRRSVLGEEA